MCIEIEFKNLRNLRLRLKNGDWRLARLRFEIGRLEIKEDWRQEIGRLNKEIGER